MAGGGPSPVARCDGRSAALRRVSAAGGIARNGAGRPALPAAVVSLLVLLGISVAAAHSAHARDPQGVSTESLEAQTHELVNEHRRAAGLPPLGYSRELAAIARRHSVAMAAGTVPFGHDGAEGRQRRIERSVPLEAMAENVGVNNAPARRTARMTVSGWLDSPGHRANIEGDYDTTGIGIARSRNGAWYFTQIFVKRGGERPRRIPR